MIVNHTIKTSNLYYKYRGYNKAFVRRGEHQICCPQTRVTSNMLPLNQSNIRYVTLWIPLILGAKMLHVIVVTWPWGHTYQANYEWPCYKYYVSICSHNNNTSSFNPTNNCHPCSQGYKYKLLCLIVKEFSAFIHLPYSGNTL